MSLAGLRRQSGAEKESQGKAFSTSMTEEGGSSGREMVVFATLGPAIAVREEARAIEGTSGGFIGNILRQSCKESN